MAVPNRQNAIDHVVAVMFEDRSFDHLLGRLYQPGEVKSFEGVIGRELGKSIPEWAEDGAEQGSVSYGTAENRDTPNADPSGEFQHVNTQLFGMVDPLPHMAGGVRHRYLDDRSAFSSVHPVVDADWVRRGSRLSARVLDEPARTVRRMA